MAQLNRPDYSFQGQVPTAAIIQAYQQKAMAEQQAEKEKAVAKEQKWVDIAKMVQSGADLVTKLTEQSKQKAMQDAQVSMQSLLGRSAEPRQMGETATTYGETPEYKAELTSLLSQADPTAFNAAASKQAAAELFPGSDRGKVTGRDISQFHLVSPNGGERIPVRYDEVTGEMTHVITQQPIDKAKYANYQMVRNGPQVRKNATGDYIVIDPTANVATGVIGSGAEEIPKEKYGTVGEINHPLVKAEDRREIVKTIASINSDPIMRAAVKTVPMLNNVERYLETDNKVAIDRLGGLTQKLIAMDSGNLAAWEQRDPGSREVIEKIKQFAKMHAKGTLTKKNKAEMVDVLKTARTNLALNVQASAGMKMEQMLELYPVLNKEAMYKKAGMLGMMKYISGDESFGDAPSAGGKPSLDSIFGGGL